MNKMDILNRQPFIDKIVNLVNMLSNDKRGCSFAIDGEWGVGKSFVLERIENQIEQIQSEETCDNQYYVFHYNCWQYDYYEEPIVAIVSAMLDKAELMTESRVDGKLAASWNVVKTKLLEISGEFLKNKIGINVVGIINDIHKEEEQRKKANKEFDNWFSFKKTVEKISSIIKTIAEDKTIVIVVDELDRCLPEYAIKVLERLHHLFDGLDNVVLVFAIDSGQLKQSIETIYGQGTDVDKYLKKFISFKMDLDYGEVQDSIWEEHADYFSMFEGKLFDDESDVRLIIKDLFSKAKLDIRQKKVVIEKLKNIHKLIALDKQDYSVMLFEVMTALFDILRRPNGVKDMNELSNIDLRNYRWDDVKITEYCNYIKKLIKDYYNNHRRIQTFESTYCEIKSSFAAAFYYLKGLYSDKNTLNDKDIGKFQKGQEMCRKFEKYRKLLQ